MRNSKSIESFSQNRYNNALFRESPIGSKIYKNRIKIEQLFSVLKGLYNLENPRLYGENHYKRYIKQVLMSYLIDKLSKKKANIKTRKYPWNLQISRIFSNIKIVKNSYSTTYKKTK